MEKSIILQGITVDQLLEKIDTIVENRLKERLEQLVPKKEVKFLTRKEVGSILKVSMPTLNIWTKEGLLNSYRIGARILYKSDEIESTLIKRRFR